MALFSKTVLCEILPLPFGDCKEASEMGEPKLSVYTDRRVIHLHGPRFEPQGRDFLEVASIAGEEHGFVGKGYGGDSGVRRSDPNATRSKDTELRGCLIIEGNNRNFAEPSKMPPKLIERADLSR
jgi:hypothetical protein